MKGQKIKRLLALAIAAAMFLSTGSGALAEGTSPSESTTAQTVADGETQSTAKRKAMESPRLVPLRSATTKQSQASRYPLPLHPSAARRFRAVHP